MPSMETSSTRDSSTSSSPFDGSRASSSSRTGGAARVCVGLMRSRVAYAAAGDTCTRRLRRRKGKLDRMTSPAALAEQLRAIDYLADEGLATAAYLAMAMHRPLLLEGDAGTGKTSLAAALAQLLDAPLLRLQC